MPLVEKQVLVEYSAVQMYALVEHIETYPEFLPWCGGADVLHREDGKTRATLHIDYHGLKQNFTTENLNHPSDLIVMKLIDGPFSRLDGEWRFKALGESASKVEFRLTYEFSNLLLGRIVGPVFHMIANSFVEAFVQRAQTVYGKR